MFQLRLLPATLLGLAVLAVSCEDQNAKQLARTAFVRHVDELIASIHEKADAFQYGEAAQLASRLATELHDDRTTDVTTYDELEKRIQAVTTSVVAREDEFNAKIRAGWKIQGKRLVSPDEQARIAQEERDREKARLIAEQEAATLRAERESRARMEAESAAAREEEARRLEAEREQREREREEQAENARRQAEIEQNLHLVYAEQAKIVLDLHLRLLSDIQIGVNYSEYTDSLQTLNFAALKLAEYRFKNYASYKHIAETTNHFKSALTSWNEELTCVRKCIESGRSTRRCDFLDDAIKVQWSMAAGSYSKAVTALAAGD